MFSRDKTSGKGVPDAPVTPAPESPDATEAGKGRPTPRRKDAEAANKRPLVPTDRRTFGAGDKSARKAMRDAQREQREREYRAMQTGEERYLPPRDKGPVRRYVRDYVDSRWNLGEFFLPVAAFFLVAQLVLASAAPGLAAIALLVLYVYVIAAIVDGFVLWQLLKRRLAAKFGAEKVIRGTWMYAVLRAFQIRPSRLPKPQVKRGQKPQ